MSLIDGPDPLPFRIDDGLLLRRANPADAVQVASLLELAHAVARGSLITASAQAVSSPPALWALDLIERPHPTMSAADVLVVEDTSSGAIVSTANLIPQTWTYGGVPFGVGRVELVATHPEYWRMGLVRRQFEVLHRWSAEHGDLVQAISGIPNFYRRFGYEMALALGGGRAAYRTQIPALPPGIEERFHIRMARLDDVPMLLEIDRHACDRSLVACVRDEAMLHYEMVGRTAGSLVHGTVLAFELDQRVVGFALLGNASIPMLGRSVPPTAQVSRFELAPDVPWFEATHALLRYLTGRSSVVPADGPFEEVVFSLGAEHPSYAVATSALTRRLPSRAWYIRVADLPRLVERIRPVLEARLAASPARGYVGDFLVNFYRDGLRLSIRAGHVAAEPGPGVDFRSASASFPDLTFLQLLFGHRSLAELEDWFDDCVVRTDEARLVLNALFPKTPSAVWPLA